MQLVIRVINGQRYVIATHGDDRRNVGSLYENVHEVVPWPKDFTPDPDETGFTPDPRTQEEVENGVPSWSNFRHWLKESTVFQKAMSPSVPAVLGSALIDALRQKDLPDLKRFSNQLDQILSFTTQEKLDVNAQATYNNLGDVIFEGPF